MMARGSSKILVTTCMVMQPRRPNKKFDKSIQYVKCEEGQKLNHRLERIYREQCSILVVPGTLFAYCEIS
jgi:hypothetical protein